MGGHLDPKHGVFLGGWGNFGVPTPMKGITTYSLSQNRQRPAAGMLYNAFFNTYRRAKAQVLYVLPPFIAAYALMDWATKKNEYLMSKPGRLAHGGDDE
ncbi:ubiquinol-cytochrome C reductase complex subunit UcrQ [Trichophyton rubrum]|uniref:Cytochrome b-c1 complex subunit 8 n=2 Tax=Trichophyton TaxID=5550 RepID=A0A178ERM2_TRIRU|nr:Cytochrome b-c1 complex subunit 8 [Trichophyton rubrum]OAL62711.1 ubiquinol-cytochrome C reductase complex subunit UcrQ [Trichophyton rubrum]OAL75587.1 ubiquinol-cytochrome C reductase complex subunit UcrQ [Trichophyton violaceum]